MTEIVYGDSISVIGGVVLEDSSGDGSHAGIFPSFIASSGCWEPEFLESGCRTIAGVV